METFSSISLWGYEETIEELKNKLWATICELEELRNNSREELRKKEENINKLIYLVKAANQERDETRHQLQMLLNKLTLPDSVEPLPVAAPRAARGSSSNTGSENLTDAAPSPTVIDGSFSPDPSIANFAAEDNTMEMVFDRLGKKPLPAKGGLLEAVIDAGPILETLLVAGSLPRWRNPPPLKAFLVPPMSISGDNASLKSSLILNCKRQRSQ